MLRAPSVSDRSTTQHADGFRLCLGFVGPSAIVAVHGEVDILTAPFLGPIVDLALRSAEGDVILDLRGLHFIDGAGSRAIAAAAQRLRAAERRLVLRSAPPMTVRVLDLMGFSTLVTYAAATSAEVTSGSEQTVGDRSGTVPSGRRNSGTSPSRGSIPAGQAVLDAALGLVVELASATVDGADGVSVSLERHGTVSTVAATDSAVEQVDAHQYETGEGPCLAAKELGRWIHIESLAEEVRWPAFVPRARAEGIKSILSTPLMSADRPVGSLNIYSRTERSFGSRQQELADLFATQVSGILIEGEVEASAGEVPAWFNDGLKARATIAHAEGILMAQRHVTPHGASLLLYRAARMAEQTVLQQAEELIADAHDVLAVALDERLAEQRRDLPSPRTGEDWAS